MLLLLLLRLFAQQAGIYTPSRYTWVAAIANFGPRDRVPTYPHSQVAARSAAIPTYPPSGAELRERPPSGRAQWHLPTLARCLVLGDGAEVLVRLAGGNAIVAPPPAMAHSVARRKELLMDTVSRTLGVVSRLA